MAFDGFVISNLTYELSQYLTDGRVQKIAQPEKDELLLTIKNNRTNYRLVISAGASLPLVYLTENNKTSPLTAPNFCMLLRKHLNGAKILSITQPGFERIIEIEMENLNELGDLTTKYLVIECMGKHSNIIFLDHTRTIIDSIKHVSSLVSSIREVLPGKSYFVPNTQEKINPLTLSSRDFIERVLCKPLSVTKAIYMTLTGFSPLVANELAYSCRIDGDSACASLTEEEKSALGQNFTSLIKQVQQHKFSPSIMFNGSIPHEFSSIPIHVFESMQIKEYNSISRVIENYYGEKDVISRIRQKSVDLRKTITIILERDRKKLALQEKQLNDTKKREKYKIYGELIQTYGYQLTPEDNQLTCTNFYDEKEITIPIDSSLTPMENATKYFNRYNKLKRTFEALSIQIQEVQNDINHLESVLTSLDFARREEDLAYIKEELAENGYLRKGSLRSKGKKFRIPKSNPLHFISSDGYDIYVGKNNFQNEELTFKFATGGDWWFHAKNMAGSHVIVKCNGEEPPIRTFEEAGSLAAYFSKGRGAEKVEIDYTMKKHVKKPNGGKPGFVIYHTNYSLIASSDISGITCASKEDMIFLERSYV